MTPKAQPIRLYDYSHVDALNVVYRLAMLNHFQCAFATK